MKKILFFGDSLTSAENNHYNGFVEKLLLRNVFNYGVSGTTIGKYSLYPVKENDLMSLLYKNEDEIRFADIVVLEYGCNDVSAIIAKNITLQQVELSLVKAVDFITQINNNVKIYFLSLGRNVQSISKKQCKYLNEIYLKAFDISFSHTKWKRIYNSFVSSAKRFLSVINMPELLSNEYDVDDLHPNDKGYQHIAEELLRHL